MKSEFSSGDGARLVPSEIVRVIDRLLTYAATPDPPNVKLTSEVNGRVSAIISLMDRLQPEHTATARGQGYQYSGEPVWHLRRHLSMCADESPARAGRDLLFVDEPQLRRDLCIDLAEAYSSLHAGRWKAATVLAGAIIEALLVWRLSKLSAPERKTASEKLPQEQAKKARPRQGEPETWDLWQ